jgi:hypothetical protein
MDETIGRSDIFFPSSRSLTVMSYFWFSWMHSRTLLVDGVINLQFIKTGCSIQIFYQEQSNDSQDIHRIRLTRESAEISFPKLKGDYPDIGTQSGASQRSSRFPGRPGPDQDLRVPSPTLITVSPLPQKIGTVPQNMCDNPTTTINSRRPSLSIRYSSSSSARWVHSFQGSTLDEPHNASRERYIAAPSIVHIA